MVFLTICGVALLVLDVVLDEVVILGGLMVQWF